MHLRDKMNCQNPIAKLNILKASVAAMTDSRVLIRDPIKSTYFLLYFSAIC
jgi:hypothetical protein